jgi:large subunit ribosomal protein L3
MKMAIGLKGHKEGMTRVFNAEGDSIPVTVIVVEPNKVTQVKSISTDGYNAIQVTSGERHLNRLNKAEAGHFAKANVQPGIGLVEFRLSADQSIDQYHLGQQIDVAMFNVTSTSIGKGFAGCIKRHHFSSQRQSHGNSVSHRAPGSIGQNQTPGRVFKGKRMAGHLGNVRVTIQNLEVVSVDTDKGLLLVKGSVPGYKGRELIVRPAVKSAQTVSAV